MKRRARESMLAAGLSLGLGVALAGCSSEPEPVCVDKKERLLYVDVYPVSYVEEGSVTDQGRLRKVLGEAALAVDQYRKGVDLDGRRHTTDPIEVTFMAQSSQGRLGADFDESGALVTAMGNVVKAGIEAMNDQDYEGPVVARENTTLTWAIQPMPMGAMESYGEVEVDATALVPCSALATVAPSAGTSTPGR